MVGDNCAKDWRRTILKAPCDLDTWLARKSRRSWLKEKCVAPGSVGVAGVAGEVDSVSADVSSSEVSEEFIGLMHNSDSSALVLDACAPMSMPILSAGSNRNGWDQADRAKQSTYTRSLKAGV